MTRRVILLVCILLLGAGLRLPGNFYPVALHFDEGVYIANILCRKEPTGTFYHPFLSRYLLRLAEAPPCIAELLARAPKPGEAADANFASNPAPFLHLGRGLSLLFGLLTILATYLLARRLAGTQAALGAALIIAVTPTSITLSNNLGPWGLATFMSALVFVCLARLRSDEASLRPLVLLGVALGAAVAVVYPLALLVVPVLITLGLRWRERARVAQPVRAPQEFCTVAVVALLAHLLCNVNALVHPLITLKELFVPEASLFSADSNKVTYPENLRWQIATVFDALGPTWPIGALGLLGLVLAAAIRRGLWIGMLAFTLAVLVLQPAAVVLMANRYTGPIVPLLAVGAAWLVFATGERLLRTPNLVRLRTLLPAVLLGLALVPATQVDAAYVRALRLPPTRLQALHWIEANVPPGSRVLQSIEYMSPPVLNCRLVKLVRDESIKRRPCYQITYAPVDPDLYSDAFLDYLSKSDAEYLIFNLVTPPGTMTRLHRVRRTSPVLQQRYTLLRRFEHQGLEMFYDDTTVVNPAVEIYRLTPPR